MNKRFLALLGLSPLIASAHIHTDFPDVASNHSYYEAITYVHEQDIVNGYEDGTFRPESDINRVEFLKILLEADSTPRACTERYYIYNDTERNAWYDSYIQEASNCGIVEGYSDGSFRPANAINYAEAAKIIVETLDPNAVSDQNPRYAWYQPYIQYIDNAGARPNHTIQPDHLLTRGEMAQIIFRLKDTSSSETSSQSTGTIQTGDISNTLLTSRDPNCESYVGTYTSSSYDTLSGKTFTGNLTITSNGDTCTFTTNQIPNHPTGQQSQYRGTIQENQASFTITTKPQKNSSPQSLGFGANAIMLNGIKWDAYPAACFGVGSDRLGSEKIGCSGRYADHPWRYNLGSTYNGFGVDIYNAHLQGDGLYHYHITPKVLYSSYCEGNTESPVIGFASDGFPIYGPCFKDSSGNIRMAQSSYRLKSGIRQDVAGYTTPYKTGGVVSDEYNGQFVGDHEYVSGLGDLDICNGMTVDGQYGYYVTENYPYVTSCVSGTPNNNFGR